jgi:hypothetical protein
MKLWVKIKEQELDNAFIDEKKKSWYKIELKRAKMF